jgi:hypothetical protein
MDKVIVERPRIGSRAKSRKKGYRKYIASTPMEELPKREPMLGRWRGRDKWLNEHLGPMRRFLRSNVGRPWEKIHQDLCEHISFDNAVQSHVLDHIFDFVNEHATVIRSCTVYAQWRWTGNVRKLSVGEMYICPKSRILKVVKPSKRQHQANRFVTSPTVNLLRSQNNWWEVRLSPMPECPGNQWDVWLERNVIDILTSGQFASYGKKYFAVSKRLLNCSEVRRMKKPVRRSKH